MGEIPELPKLDSHEWVLAVDPGAAGGIARLWGSGEVEAWNMPTGEEAIAEFFRERLSESGCRSVFIEKVWGRQGNSARSNTTFMTHYGVLRGCLFTSRIDYCPPVPVVDVLPSEWQKKLGAPKMSRDKALKASTRKSQHKNALKLMALGMFPDAKVTLKTCDALLIVEYGRRQFA